MAGYSDTPLLQKLGYQAGQSLMLLGAPDWFKDLLAKAHVKARNRLPADHAHLFAIAQTDLHEHVTTELLEKIAGALWVSWPKKASGIATDITEQTLRDIILPFGWVDIKVAAIDDTWSGMKFVRRRA